MKRIRYRAGACLLALALLLSLAPAALAAGPALTALTIRADGITYYSELASGTLSLPAGVTQVQIDYARSDDTLTVTCNGAPLASGDLVSVSSGETLKIEAGSETYTIRVVYEGQTQVDYALSVQPSGAADADGKVYYKKGDTLTYEIYAAAARGENIGSFQFVLDYQSSWLQLTRVSVPECRLESRDAGGKLTLAAVCTAAEPLAMTGAPVKIASVELRVIQAPAANTEEILAPKLSAMAVTPRGYDSNTGALAQDEQVNKAVLQNKDNSGGGGGGGGGGAIIVPGGGDEPEGTECPRDETCPIEPFTDTQNDAWWHDGIHYCVENGLMKGVTTSLFAPYRTTSRAMIVTILWRMEGSPVVNYAMTFEDVPDGQWCTEAIRWAQATGVVMGFDAGQFGPSNNITREQLAAILFRYASYKEVDVSERASLEQFTDVDRVGTWALEAIRWATAAGIVTGRSNATIDPKSNATRAEAACMIQRFCQNVLGR